MKYVEKEHANQLTEAERYLDKLRANYPLAKKLNQTMFYSNMTFRRNLKENDSQRQWKIKEYILEET